MLSNENEYTTLKNHGFSVINNMFMENGWKLVRNELEWVTYTKTGQETDVFDLMVEKDKIVVTVPIKNSPYQYRTIFKTYWEAVEYVEKRFHDFVN